MDSPLAAAACCCCCSRRRRCTSGSSIKPHTSVHAHALLSLVFLCFCLRLASSFSPSLTHSLFRTPSSPPTHSPTPPLRVYVSVSPSLALLPSSSSRHRQADRQTKRERGRGGGRGEGVREGERETRAEGMQHVAEARGRRSYDAAILTWV